jgi:hypothetical protein
MILLRRDNPARHFDLITQNVDFSLFIMNANPLKTPALQEKSTSQFSRVVWWRWPDPESFRDGAIGLSLIFCRFCIKAKEK